MPSRSSLPTNQTVDAQNSHVPPPYFIPPSHTPTYPQAYPPPPSNQQQRPDRTVRDVAEAKASRKADIERRCEALDPPIHPNVLRHMESFKAAMQITTPMTDSGWEMLKPRLQAQRNAAEEKERQEASQKSAIQQRGIKQHPQDITQREMKELFERDWEEAQRPIRAQLSSFADEIINTHWERGMRVTQHNCHQFAAAVLLYVRDRFSDQANGESTTTSTEPELTNLSGRKLMMENMKWLFDHKIKPLTDRHRKELFLCSGCEGNPKYYGFEGVIQHYGAKHTNAFSVGNVVVAWKEVEWPEEPPFVPDPTVAMNTNPGTSRATVYGMQQAGPLRGASITPQMASHVFRPGSQASPYPVHGQGGSYISGPFQPPIVSMNAPGPGYDQLLTQHRPLNGGNSNGHFYPIVPQSQSNAMPGHLSEPVRELQSYLATPANGSYPVSDGVPPLETPAQPGSKQRDSDGVAETVQHSASPEQVSFFAKEFTGTWSTLSGISELADSVRLYTVVNVTSLAFEKLYGHRPSLELFIKALENDLLLSGHRPIEDLQCRVCSRSNLPGQVDNPPSSGDTCYSILSLASHFQQQHTRRQRPGPASTQFPTPLDWTKDMIFYPASFAARLVRSEGIDDRKVDIIGSVFPGLFEEPSRDPVRHTPHEDREHRYTNRNLVNKDTQNAISRSEKTSGPQSFGSDDGNSPRSPLRFASNEYDPRGPPLGTISRHRGNHVRQRSHRGNPDGDYYQGPFIYVGNTQSLHNFSKRTDMGQQEVREGHYEDPPRYRPRTAYYPDADDEWPPFQPDNPSRRRYAHRPSTQMESDLARSPRIEQPKPDRKLPSGQSFNRPNVLDIEENGPTSDHEKHLPKDPASPSAAAAAADDANEFLDDIKGEVLEKNMLRHEEREHNNALRSSRGIDGRREFHDLNPVPRDLRSYEDEMEIMPRESAFIPTPRRIRRPEEYHTNGHTPDYRREHRPRPGALYRRAPAEPVPTSRFARYTRIREREDPSYHVQPVPRTTRPPSRYERYNLQREQLERSLSPQRRVLEHADTFRDPSIGPNRANQMSPHEQTPMAEERYSPEPHTIRYRYDEPPPTRYVDQYGRPVEMVRIREPSYQHFDPRYGNGPPMDYDPYDDEHVQYERVRRPPPIYYEQPPSYLYPREGQTLTLPERDGVSFEPELRVRAEPTATPAPFVEQQP